MKRLLLIPFLFSALYAQPRPQTFSLTAASTACQVANSCAIVNVPSTAGTITVALTGTWTATVNFEASMDGSTWFGVAGNSLSGSGVLATSVGSNNLMSFQLAALYQFRLRLSAYTSGTVQAAIYTAASAGFPNGNIQVIGASVTTGDAAPMYYPYALGGIASPYAIGTYIFNATNGWDRLRSANVTTFASPVSIGAVLSEKGPRWTFVSAPAAGTQATASRTAQAAQRNVADCVSFSASSVVAPALTALTINLRDGATGAGTIIWTHTVAISANTGQNLAPFAVCGLNLVGSINTAMTLEFSASLANLSEAVSVSGYTVQ